MLLERLASNRRSKFRHILKGAAIGNGLHNYEINFNTQIFYAHSHGLIGPYLWGEILSDCCQNVTEQCNFYAMNNTDICALEVSEVTDYKNTTDNSWEYCIFIIFTKELIDIWN